MTRGREMPIFRLNSKITVSAYTEVAAESLDDAIEASRLRCAWFQEDADISNSWRVDDLDGEPFDIEGEES